MLTFSFVLADLKGFFCAAFEEAEKNAPAIIFIDELDAIAPKRDKVFIQALDCETAAFNGISC